MIKKNIEIAKKTVEPISQYLTACVVVGSSVYLDSGANDIDIFIVIDPVNINNVDSLLRQRYKITNSRTGASYFNTNLSNWLHYDIVKDNEQVSLIFCNKVLFEAITQSLEDHLAYVYRRDPVRRGKSSIFCGIDGSRRDNNASAYDSSTKLYSFPINQTLDDLYFANIPMSNLLGPTYPLFGEEYFENRIMTLKSLIQERYHQQKGCEIENLVYKKSVMLEIVP